MKLRTFLRRAIVFGLLSSAGCSLGGSEQQPNGLDSEQVVPIKMSVAPEESDGSNRIKVNLQPVADVPTAAVELRFTGLRQGLIVEEHVEDLSEFIPVAALRAGETQEFGFTFSSEDLTGFQVALSWNLDNVVEEASGEVASKEQAEQASVPSSDAPATSAIISEPAPVVVVGDAADGAKGVEISRLETEARDVGCEQKPCPQRYTVHAVLKNEAPRPITGIRLALGMFWVNDGAKPVFPPPGAPLGNTETEVNLEGVRLKPGELRTLHLDLDRDIPRVPGGKFVANLRILSFE